MGPVESERRMLRQSSSGIIRTARALHRCRATAARRGSTALPAAHKAVSMLPLAEIHSTQAVHNVRALLGVARRTVAVDLRGLVLQLLPGAETQRPPVPLAFIRLWIDCGGCV